MTPDPTPEDELERTEIVTTAGWTAAATACQSGSSPLLLTGWTVDALVAVFADESVSFVFP
ncbi:Uncharacterised protein [Chlamydia trachomatis]|nr:Uncharacterised protein [Chlamydia trachomatis]